MSRIAFMVFSAVLTTAPFLADAGTTMLLLTDDSLLATVASTSDLGVDFRRAVGERLKERGFKVVDQKAASDRLGRSSASRPAVEEILAVSARANTSGLPELRHDYVTLLTLEGEGGRRGFAVRTSLRSTAEIHRPDGSRLDGKEFAESYPFPASTAPKEATIAAAGTIAVVVADWIAATVREKP